MAYLPKLTREELEFMNGARYSAEHKCGKNPVSDALFMVFCTSFGDEPMNGSYITSGSQPKNKSRQASTPKSERSLHLMVLPLRGVRSAEKLLARLANHAPNCARDEIGADHDFRTRKIKIVVCPLLLRLSVRS